MIDLIDKRFGRLTVLKKMDNNRHGQLMWLCLCDCGKEKIIRGNNLKSGDIKSCGCLHREIMTQHGHLKNGKTSKTYDVWHNMIQRCINPKNKYYKNYGGRGIKVCKRWMTFENFLIDMNESPGGYAIDRIDNDKGYYKSNCRWATRKEQARNKRNNRLITYRGKTQCLAEWAEKLKIPYPVLYGRFRRGWATEKALTTPVANQSGT